MTSQWTAPSVAILSHHNIRLDCDPELIRAIWKARDLEELVAVYPAAVDGNRLEPVLHVAKREAVNHAAGFHGVEYLGWHKRTGAHVYYTNAGDPYAPALIFQGRRLSVGCWGDLVERRAVDSA